MPLRCNEHREFSQLGVMYGGVRCDLGTEHVIHHDPDLDIWWADATDTDGVSEPRRSEPDSGLATVSRIHSDDNLKVAA